MIMIYLIFKENLNRFTRKYRFRSCHINRVTSSWRTARRTDKRHFNILCIWSFSCDKVCNVVTPIILKWLPLKNRWFLLVPLSLEPQNQLLSLSIGRPFNDFSHFNFPSENHTHSKKWKVIITKIAIEMIPINNA